MAATCSIYNILEIKVRLRYAVVAGGGEGNSGQLIASALSLDPLLSSNGHLATYDGVFT
jgi:hypothetical protein